MNIYSKYKSHYRENLALAIPVVISQLGHTSVQLSDTVIVGQFAGTVQLAAAALANGVFIITLIIGIGISYGITPLIAQLNGRDDYAECGRLLSNSLFINVITGIVLFAATFFSAIFLLNQLHQTPAVASQAKPFLILLGISIIPMLIFNTFKQFTEGLGFTKQAMSITIWGNLFNIVLGVILVAGFKMGVTGVGISTLADRCIMSVVMGFYVFKSQNFKKYLRTFALKNIDRLRGLKLLKIGAPVAMQYTFEISAFSAALVIIGTIGYREQAAHQITINFAAMTYMMASGISAAAAIKSGNYFGMNEHQKLRHSAISSYHIVLVFMGFTALIFAIFSHILPWIFTSDKQVIAIASQLFIIASVFQLFDGTQVVGLGILRGMGDVNIPTVITFLAYWVIGLPVGYILGLTLHHGVKGVWYGLVLGLMASSILLFLRFQYVSKKNRDKTVLITQQD